MEITGIPLAIRSPYNSIQQLPDDILLLIFFKSGIPFSHLGSIQRVSKRFYRLANNEQMWKQIAQTYFPTAQSHNVCSKQELIHHSHRLGQQLKTIAISNQYLSLPTNEAATEALCIKSRWGYEFVTYSQEGNLVFWGVNQENTLSQRYCTYLNQVGTYLSGLHHVTIQETDYILLITDKGYMHFCAVDAPQEASHLSLKISSVYRSAIIPAKNDALIAISRCLRHSDDTDLIEGWDFVQQRRIFTLEQTSNTGHLFAFTYQNTRYLFGGSISDPSFKVWQLDPVTRKPLLFIKGEELFSAFDTCDIKQTLCIIGVTCCGTIKIWEFPSGQLKTTIPSQHSQAITAAIAVRLDDNHPLFIIGNKNGFIEIWNLKTKKRLKAFQGHDGEIYYFQSFRIGQQTLLLSGSSNYQSFVNKMGKLMVWDLDLLISTPSPLVKLFNNFIPKK
jgi:WD40 repeat protein